MSENWYVGRDGNRSGPFSSTVVREMAARGDIRPTDMLWKEGMPAWALASSIPGLFASPSQSQPPPVAVNPYAAPSTSELSSPFSSSMGRPPQFAEYLPRVGAAILDGIFVGLMGCVPGIAIGFAVALAAAGSDEQTIEAMSIGAQTCSNLLGWMISAVYYVTLETTQKQATWGKQIVGIKVTDLNGNRLTAGRAIGRWFAKIITGCTCGIGLLMPLFTEKKQTLHDMIAGCLALNK
ncbi:MAG: RDD family protein [Planctomycetaceae bacterium]